MIRVGNQRPLKILVAEFARIWPFSPRIPKSGNFGYDRMPRPVMLLVLVAAAMGLAGACRNDASEPPQQTTAPEGQKPAVADTPLQPPASAAEAPTDPSSESIAEPPALPPRPRDVASPPGANAAGATQPSPPPQYTPPTTVEALKQEELAVASRFVEDFPGSPDAIGLLGNVHSKHGNNDEAVQCWRRGLQLDPRRASAYDAMATVAMRKGDYEEAVSSWRRTIEIDPQLFSVHYRLARALLAWGKVQEAIAELHKDIERSPGASNSYYLLGQAHLQLKQYGEAKRDYLAAIEIQADHAPAYYGLTTASARLRQTEQSKEYMKKFRELKARQGVSDRERRGQYDDMDVMRLRVAATYADAARFYYEHGQAGKAEQLWCRAAALNPADTVCRSQLASLYRKSNRLEEALEIFGQLQELEPENAACYLHIGSLCARLSRVDSAEAAFRKAVELDPARSSAYAELAQLYIRANRKLVEATTLAEQAVRLEPVATHHFILGAVLAKRGELDKALSAMQRAVALDPNNTKYRQIYEHFKAQK